MTLLGSFRAMVGRIGWTDPQGVRIESVAPVGVVVISGLDHTRPPVGTGRIDVRGTALVLEGRFHVWTAEGRQAFDRVRSGAVLGWSISWWGNYSEEAVDGRLIRTYAAAQVYEASPTTAPTDPTTTTLEIEGRAFACPAYANIGG